MSLKARRNAIGAIEQANPPPTATGDNRADDAEEQRQRRRIKVG